MRDEAGESLSAGTSPGLADWPPTDAAFRRSEVAALIGRGPDVWERASTDILRWAVKSRSGFRVDDSSPVQEGRLVDVTVSVLGLTVVEPVEVMEVVAEPGRTGFAYRTRPGHPIDGEEAFIVSRDGDRVFSRRRAGSRAGCRSPRCP